MGAAGPAPPLRAVAVAQSRLEKAAARSRKCTSEQLCGTTSGRTVRSRRPGWRFSEPTLSRDPAGSPGVYATATTRSRSDGIAHADDRFRRGGVVGAAAARSTTPPRREQSRARAACSLLLRARGEASERSDDRLEPAGFVEEQKSGKVPGGVLLIAQSDSAAQARGTGGKPRFKPGPYKREERPEKTAPRVDGKAASRPAARRSESD